MWNGVETSPVGAAENSQGFSPGNEAREAHTSLPQADAESRRTRSGRSVNSYWFDGVVSGRIQFNERAAAITATIFKISPGRNGSAPAASAWLQFIAETTASQEQPAAKTTTSPASNAPTSRASE